MVIIHYFLGFPPYRSGGLTKYSVDLMNAQAQNGDTIIALWPGRINLLLKQSRIIKKKNVNNIVNYELVRSEERRVGKECRCGWSRYH